MQVKNPNLVNIGHSDTALNMILWCRKNLQKNHWEMNLVSMQPLCYQFKFNSRYDKLMAALNG